MNRKKGVMMRSEEEIRQMIKNCRKSLRGHKKDEIWHMCLVMDAWIDALKWVLEEE